MDTRAGRPQTELTALSISPNREMAQQFAATLSTTRAFHILAELKSYPPLQTLDIRLRQLRPDLVFLDLATDLDKAAELIEFIAAVKPPIHVIGLHTHNDSDAILRSLRAGATEFLHAPFGVDVQKEVLGRITRLRKPQSRVPTERGRMLAFSSCKPGSGASTLAAETACALRKTGKRVLLADFDLWNGIVAFLFKVNQFSSLIDALRQMEHDEQMDWPALVANADGLDLLAAPEFPQDINIDPDRLHEVLETARGLYDWIVVDLSGVFNKLSLLTISDADDSFLVSTAELPSLHLTRKAVAYLGGIGFPPDRYRVVVNRVNKQEGMTSEDMAKIFGAPVHATFPNDYLALHKGLTVGQPLGNKCALGRTIEEFAANLTSKAAAEKKKSGASLN
ncbi:MAG: AAA family ATPase [Bryobacteraceae bacterium]